MRIALFNANGLSGKIDPIHRFTSEHRIDYIFLLETWQRQTRIDRGMGHPFLCLTKPDDRTIQGGRRAVGGISLYRTNPDISDPKILHTDPEADFAIIQVEQVVVGVGYFPPQRPIYSNKLFRFLELTEELAQGGPCIACGDFNARAQKLTGDSITNPRGARMTTWLEESGTSLQYKTPDSPLHFTTFTATGQGITDLVLFSAVEIPALTIHNNTLGGSDHFPPVFDVPSIHPPPKGEFQRWNIRKLAQENMRRRYTQALETHYEQVEERITRPQTTAEQAWMAIRGWIEQALEASCGKFHFRSGQSNREFWTEDMITKRHEIEEHQQILLESQSRGPTIRTALFTLVKQLNAELKDMIKERKRSLFEDAVHDLSLPQNQQAFLRMVKGRSSAQRGKHCPLDPERIDEHVEYFRSTFGSPSTAEPYAPPPQLLPEENQARPEEPFDDVDLAAVWKTIPVGKAAGTDGIMGEAFAYGGRHARTLFKTLCNRIYKEGMEIPQDWKTALIVPVYKNKGSDQDIANYRPIALTCCARRIYERLVLRKLQASLDHLSKWQRGFRMHRSTLDQVYVLDEIIRANPKLHNVYLDLKAAYDLVERQLLWKRMSQE